MKLILEVNNIAKSSVRDAFLNSVVKKTLKESRFKFLINRNITISIALVNAEEIKNINKIYRRKNETTDILSFSEYKNINELKSAVDNPLRQPAEGLFLGELVLCYDYIKEYAEKRKTKLDQELANAVSHGILHLLGFKHGKKMFLIQSAVVSQQ